jgi:hypothetical protein
MTDTERKEVELKPCPFCGCNFPEKLTGMGEYWIKCPKCNSSCDMKSNADDCVNAWNKRPQENNEFGHSGDKTVSSYPEDNQQPPKDQYPCNDCGKLRSKAEGGTTFSVCDECWDKKYPKERKVSLEDIQNVIYLENRKQAKYLSMIDIHNIAEVVLSLLNAKESTEKESL